jgi:hypothetical protein
MSSITASNTISTNSINAITATSGTIDIGVSQTNGILNIGTGASRSGNINIANGTTTSSVLNIHNGSGSSGSVNIANGNQSTTVNIANGTASGTVTIGNANNIVAINGQPTLGRALGLGSIATLATQLGYRSNTLITGTYSTSTTDVEEASSFVFEESGVWYVEFRCRVNTVSLTEISLGTTSGVLSADRTVITNNAVVGITTFLTTTVSEADSLQTWYINVQSNVAVTSIIEFTLVATRIG